MGVITIVGLGPGGNRFLTVEARRLILEAPVLMLRTDVHPAAQELKNDGVEYESFDYLYETADSFEQIYETIADKLVSEASLGKDIVYAVPGHPMVGESSVALVLERARASAIKVRVIPGLSFVDTISSLLGFDPASGCSFHDALSFSLRDFRVHGTNVFMQVHNKLVASELKLGLMEVLPDEHPIIIIHHAGIPEEEMTEERPLHEMDFGDFDHLTSIVVFPEANDRGTGPRSDRCHVPLDDLVDVMARLRSEDGCPWDLKQTHESLKRYFIEETYEAIEAIEQRRMDKLCEELGDVLLQVVFHARIASESGEFDMNDVISGIVEKLVRRHPHVFGDTEATDEKAVLRNWEQIKASESGNAERESILDGVPPGLPALMAAEEVQKKASRVGFDWDDASGALDKLKEELQELVWEIGAENRDPSKLVDEGGDLIFAAVNLLRLLGISAEFALRRANAKFTRRFQYIERRAAETGVALDDMSLQQMDQIWEEAKKSDPPPVR